MTEPSYFSRQVEILDQQRDRSLSWFLGSFLVWTLSMVGAQYAVLLLGTAALWAVGPILFISMGLWILFLGRYLWVQYRIRSDPQLAEILNDELVRTAWRRAAASGFWALLAVVVLMTLVRTATTVSVGLGVIPIEPAIFVDVRVPLGLAVGVGVTIGVYLHQRRER